MANVMIAFPNRADDATLSGGSWNASLPLTNLQDRQLSQVARSTNALTTSTTMDIDQGVTGSPSLGPSVRVIALLHGNFSQNATYGAIADPSDLNTPDYDSGVTAVWPTKYTSEQLGYYPWNLIHVAAATQHHRYWRLSVIDTANSAGRVQAGRLFLGPAWVPERINMIHGPHSMGWGEPMTTVGRSLSGARSFERHGSAPRVVRFTVPAMEVADAMRVYDLQAGAGIDQEVLFIYDYEDSTYALQRNFLGTLRQLTSIELPVWNQWEIAFEIEELLA